MKKEIKIWLLAFFMVIATALNVMIVFDCLFSILDNFCVTYPAKWSLLHSLVFLIVSSYGIILTALYLKHKLHGNKNQ